MNLTRQATRALQEKHIVQDQLARALRYLRYEAKLSNEQIRTIVHGDAKEATSVLPLHEPKALQIIENTQETKTDETRRFLPLMLLFILNEIAYWITFTKRALREMEKTGFNYITRLFDN